MADGPLPVLDQSPMADALASDEIPGNTAVRSHAERLRCYTLLAAAFAQSEPRLAALAS